MGLFRNRKTSEADAIAAFWQWWGTVRDDIAAGVSTGGVTRYVSGLAGHVSAINDDLQWELTPGGSSAHALVVTAAGNAVLRSVAARWLAAAPSADETWSYRSSRTADLVAFEATMQIEDLKLELADVRYGITVDQDSRQIDVTCYHPAFGGLPDKVRGQVTFLTLDWTLGEDGVEIWLREIGWTATAPQNPKTPQDLHHAVAAIATDDSWVIMQGRKPDGTPVLAMAASPLRPARWPRFDLYAPVVLPYRLFNDGQLPENESLDALRAFEDQLTEALGDDGTLVAHETSGRIRILHFYVDSQSAARTAIESQLPQWPEGRASAKPRLDPAFDGVRHLMH
jgi:hypothetical protein